MSLLSLFIISILLLILFIYVLVRYVLNERQVYKIKYTLYACSVMCAAIILQPLFFIRARNASNIRLAALALNPVLRLFGLKYRVENAEVLDNDGPCVIVANHQSSLDFIGMMNIWPEHVRYCTILAKRELIWAGPFGSSSWLAGVEFVDRKNRHRSSETMRHILRKITHKSLRLWIFPEGRSIFIIIQLIRSFFLLSKQAHEI